MIKKFTLIGLILALMATMVAACHCDHNPKPLVAVGNLLCADGSFISADAIDQTNSKPVAVVFYVNTDENVAGQGYAIWLREIEEGAFADSLGIKQGTSGDMTAFDGNANTFEMYACDDVSSPIAQKVFSVWSHGQSAYIPSVGQMRLIYRARDIINSVIAKVGGDVIPVDDRYCWYWTSTEVKDQETFKAWLYSLGAGVAQETPKNEVHKLRPIITITD